MFEYHGNNLKLDADGVSVTVRLPEPLDIEKPLADLALTNAEVVGAAQWIVYYEHSSYGLEPEEENVDKEYLARGFELVYEGYESEPDYPGDANAEVLARIIPELELGVRGLLAWCAQESKELRVWQEAATLRVEEVKKIRQERAEAEAMELERIMPKRDTKIGFEELKALALKAGMKLIMDGEDEIDDVEFEGEPLWRQINGRKFKLSWSNQVTRYEIDDEDWWPGQDKGLTLCQDTDGTDKYNNRLATVVVSERGYFNVKPDLEPDKRVEYASPLEALEASAPWVIEGEEDKNWDSRGPLNLVPPPRRRKK